MSIATQIANAVVSELKAKKFSIPFEPVMLVLPSFEPAELQTLRVSVVPRATEIESRYIPDEVKREVFRRDGGQCLCCGIKQDLEYDHIYPYSKGGQNTVDNLQLLCRRCNASKNTGTHCRIHGKDLSLKP